MNGNLFIVFLVLFLSCVGTGRKLSTFVPINKKLKNLDSYTSCTGKGVIVLRSDYLNSRVNFNFKAQSDSAFLQLTDLLGRKVFLIWISSTGITIRDMINNQEYDDAKIKELFPMFYALPPTVLMDLIVGINPDYVKKDYKNLLNEKKIKMKISYDNNVNKEKVVSKLEYYQLKTENLISIKFNKRDYNNFSIDTKKYWRLLKY